MLVIPWIAALAHAGVGDPIDGAPSWAERDLHLWTNAVRLDPEAFAKDYAEGGCDLDDFDPAERLPVGPVRWHHDLGRVARGHSADMAATGVLSHDSSDGTSMVERIQGAYGTDRPFGENVARGYLDARSTVLQGWMCSPGHRVNLVDPRWDDAGLGVVETWWTQNLGRSGGPMDPIPVAVHRPQAPVDVATVHAVVVSAEGEAPDRVVAVIDGEVVPLERTWGAADAGVWSGSTAADGRCTPWFVEVAWGAQVVRWPEEGSHAWGRCAFDDPQAGWLDVQLEPGEGPWDTDPWEDTGLVDDTDVDGEDLDGEADLVPWSNLCSTLGGGLVGLPLIVVAAGATRRRRHLSAAARARPARRSARRDGPPTAGPR